mgnify:FL=1
MHTRTKMQLAAGDRARCLNMLGHILVCTRTRHLNVPRILFFYKKTVGKAVFLKEILDEPKFLWYDIRANGRYRSFFYAQKTIAMNREKAALQRN